MSKKGTAVERAREQWMPLGGSARALWFAEGVRSGAIPSCWTIQQGVERWFELKERAAYNAGRVDDVISTIQSMLLPEGEAGVRFEPSPWQCWTTSWLYGFETPEGTRLVRQFMLVVPRKAGKSSLTAAWALYEMVKPWGGMAGCEVAFCGVTEDTAKIAYKKLGRILTRDEIQYQRKGFCGRHLIKNNATEVQVKRTNARAYPLTTGGRNIDGITLRMAIIDEIAAMDDAGAIETIRTGMGHDMNSLVCLTTTPHDKWTSAYDEEKETALNWLSGELKNDRYASVIFRAETTDLDKEFSPELWEKVHPRFGGGVDEGFYEAAAAHAQTSPVNLHRFRTRLLCADSVLAGTWVTPNQLEVSDDPPVDPERAECDRWVIGVDTSDISDMSALCLLGLKDETGEVLIYWDLHTPSTTIPGKAAGSKRDAEIREWAAEGYLTVHDKRIDHQVLADRLTQWADKYRPLGIYADNHTSMNEATFRCPPHVRALVYRRGKSAQTMAEPMASLATWVADGLVKFQKNPACIDHFKNVRIVETREGARIPTKTAIGGRKIDAVDATLMAVMGVVLSRDDKLAGTPQAPRQNKLKVDDKGRKQFPPSFIS